MPVSRFSRFREQRGFPAKKHLSRVPAHDFDSPFMTEEQQDSAARSKNPMDLTHFDVEVLSRYVTDTGKILPRRITSLTALQQRHITRQIKRARNLLLMK